MQRDKPASTVLSHDKLFAPFWIASSLKRLCVWKFYTHKALLYATYWRNNALLYPTHSSILQHSTPRINTDSGFHPIHCLNFNKWISRIKQTEPKCNVLLNFLLAHPFLLHILRLALLVGELHCHAHWKNGEENKISMIKHDTELNDSATKQKQTKGNNWKWWHLRGHSVWRCHPSGQPRGQPQIVDYPFVLVASRKK